MNYWCLLGLEKVHKFCAALRNLLRENHALILDSEADYGVLFEFWVIVEILETMDWP